jgi:predicted porin
MNKNIKLAVAGAVLALGATAAQAGIVIPAGEWTLDVNGNVNAFYIYNDSKDTNTIRGGLAQSQSTTSGDQSSSINTGLLPSWLGVTGKSRQNDLDTEFTISLQPGASQKASLGGGGGSEFRQAYFSFGDKSWGTILVGKNLGQFGRDAILNDQTLLGVGSQGVAGAAGGTTTTLGRIGAGFLYADFNGQINYTTPNMNGLELTVGIDQPMSTNNLGNTAAVTTTTATALSVTTAAETLSLNAVGTQKNPAFVGVARYSFTANDVTGKLWVEGKSQKIYGTSGFSGTSSAAGIGANVNAAGFGAVAYYYKGEGAGTTAFLMDGYSAAGGKRDSDGGYIQLSYVLPMKTKLAASWGRSNLDKANGESASNLVKSNEMTTIGLYHPLTKHLNLVGEYSRVESENHATIAKENKTDILSVGGILFF